jgi:hypothetical protein
MPRTLLIGALLLGAYALTTWTVFLLFAEHGGGRDPLDPEGT